MLEHQPNSPQFLDAAEQALVVVLNYERRLREDVVFQAEMIVAGRFPVPANVLAEQEQTDLMRQFEEQREKLKTTDPQTIQEMIDLIKSDCAKAITTYNFINDFLHKHIDKTLIQTYLEYLKKDFEEGMDPLDRQLKNVLNYTAQLLAAGAEIHEIHESLAAQYQLYRLKTYWYCQANKHMETYVKKCPNVNCKGFLLLDQLRCEYCKKSINDDDNLAMA